MQLRHKAPRCPVCKSKTERMLSRIGLDSWKPITLEHINVDGEGPLRFEKKRDLKAYCKKHGLSSGALL